MHSVLLRVLLCAAAISVAAALAQKSAPGPFWETAFALKGGSAYVSLAVRLGWMLTPQDFGAIGDGVTDDGAALNTAFAAVARNHAKLMLPAKTYFSARPLVLSAGMIEGIGFEPGFPPGVPQIKCASTVSPCLSVGASNSQASVRKLTVSHVGAPAATAIGIEVVDAYNTILEDIMSFNHGVCYSFLAHSETGRGLGAQMTRAFSSKCADAHIVVDTWPELRINQGRFGAIGSQDPANAFIRIQGGTAQTAGGPNTLDVENAQFNGGATKHFVEFVNLGAGGVPAIDATDFKFHGLHVEGIFGAYFYSDASWNIVNRLNVSGSSFNDRTPFLDLNPASQVSEWNLENNQIFGPLAFVSSRNENALLIIGNRLGSTTLDSNSGGTAAVVGNVFHGTGLTLNGNWAALSVGYNIFVGGSLTNNAAGKLLVQN